MPDESSSQDLDECLEQALPATPAGVTSPWQKSTTDDNKEEGSYASPLPAFLQKTPIGRVQRNNCKIIFLPLQH